MPTANDSDVALTPTVQVGPGGITWREALAQAPPGGHYRAIPYPQVPGLLVQVIVGARVVFSGMVVCRRSRSDLARWTREVRKLHGWIVLPSQTP